MGLVNMLFTFLATSCQCCPLSSRTATVTTAIYSIMISVVLIIIDICKIVHNREEVVLREVYYGLQIALAAIIFLHVMIILTSVFLLQGVYKFRSHYVFVWIMTGICFMSLETVATVYYNVLIDHVHHNFDSIAIAEIAFFLVRTVINIFCILAVIWFYQELRSGTIKYSYNSHDPAEEVML